MNIDIPQNLGDAALWALIVGFFSPVVLNLILQVKWSARTQALTAFAYSVVVGTITAWLSGAFNGLSIVSTILLVLVVSISAYRGFWKQATPNLKAATSADRDGVYNATSVN